jgi:hypothetical protein
MCASITERIVRGCQLALLAEDSRYNNVMFDNVCIVLYKLYILTIINTQLNDWPVMIINHCRHRPNFFI